MTFHDFARAHGLIIRDLISHRWVSTPTEDHPRKRNGRYKYLGNVGWVQNWATMESPTMWKDSAAAPVDYRKVFAESGKEKGAGCEEGRRQSGMDSWKGREEAPCLSRRQGLPRVTSQCNGTVDGKTYWYCQWPLVEIWLGFIDNRRRGKEVSSTVRERKGQASPWMQKASRFFCEGMATALSVRQAHAPCKRFAIELSVAFRQGISRR
jgi:hypothetical protein